MGRLECATCVLQLELCRFLISDLFFWYRATARFAKRHGLLSVWTLGLFVCLHEALSLAAFHSVE